MGKKWKNAPVMYTVAQVRFNQILAMGSFVPNIQEKIRASGFPDYRKEIINAFSFPLGQADNNAPVIQQAVSRHAFGNINGTAGFILENNAMSFQTTEYDVFETFLESFLNAISIVNDRVKLDYIERIGIRYLDAVMPRTDEKLSDYLVEEVLGMTFKTTGKVSHSYTETVSTNSVGGLIARVIIQNSNISLPPEIAQTAYGLSSKFKQFEGLHAVIDTDGYHEVRTAFDIDTIAKKLNDLHEEIAKSFKATASPHALKIWEFG